MHLLLKLLFHRVTTSRGALYSLAPSCVEKRRLHPQLQPRGASTTLEKMKSQELYLSITTKRRNEFL